MRYEEAIEWTKKVFGTDDVWEFGKLMKLVRQIYDSGYCIMPDVLVDDIVEKIVRGIKEGK